MSGVLVALIVCGTIAGLWWRIEPRLDRWMERSVAKPLGADDPMPADLTMAALAFSDNWAREDAMKRFYELYAEHGDWNRVRQLAGPVMMTEGNNVQ